MKNDTSMTIRLPKDLRTKLSDYAWKHRLAIGVVVREAISRRIDSGGSQGQINNPERILKL